MTVVGGAITRLAARVLDRICFRTGWLRARLARSSKNAEAPFPSTSSVAASIVVACFVLLTPHNAAADVTYTYTGKPFGLAECEAMIAAQQNQNFVTCESGAGIVAVFTFDDSVRGFTGTLQQNGAIRLVSFSSSALGIAVTCRHFKALATTTSHLLMAPWLLGVLLFLFLVVTGEHASS